MRGSPSLGNETNRSYPNCYMSNDKCEAIKQIFIDLKSYSWRPLGLCWAQRHLALSCIVSKLKWEGDLLLILSVINFSRFSSQ